MATNTQEYNFQKPEVGGDSDNWGDMLNGNWDITDSLLRGATQLSNIGIGATNTTIPLVCNAASAADITATFSGYVGIGTNQPQAPLHVIGDINLGASGDHDAADVELASLNFYNTDSSDSAPNNAAIIRAYTHTATGSGGYLTFSTSDGSESEGADAGEKMRIDASGNVGIGTDSPAGNLHISAGTDGDATLILEADTDQLGSEADNPRMELRQDGHEVEGSIYLEGDADQTASGSLGNALVIDTKDFNGNNDIQFATGGITDPNNLANSTVRMTINDSGNVGIGTKTPSHPLMVQRNDTVGSLGSASISLNPEYDHTNTDGSFIRWGGSSVAGAMLRFVGVGDVERMRIDGSGLVLIGTTDTSLHTNNSSGSSANGILCNPNGQIVAASYQSAPLSANRMGNDGSVLSLYNRGSFVGKIQSTSVGVSLQSGSDRRLKQNIEDADDAGSLIDSVQIRQFDWIRNGEHQSYGVVAQELEEVLPELVSGHDEESLTVDYMGLVPMLVKEVQALRARVAELEENA